MLDISIAVLLGVIMLATAYLGVHVTLHPAQSDSEKRAYKIGFTLCGGAACILIGVQTYRNNSAQEQLHAQITHIQSDTIRIERNTEQPPRVQVNVQPASVILQDRAPTHSKPEPDGRLQTLNNEQLKKESLIFAKQMREFERDLIERTAMYSWNGITRDGSREPDSEKSKQIYVDGVTVYNNTMLREAIALRAELWRRVGAVSPDSSMQAFEPLTPEPLRVVIERRPILDAANYLEKLAKRLPK